MSETPANTHLLVGSTLFKVAKKTSVGNGYR